ncbi:MAG: hypothetical protein EXS32_15555 [Opitutus sp.]|nr:hypothetical protein [Opitutus sp.]
MAKAEIPVREGAFNFGGVAAEGRADGGGQGTVEAVEIGVADEFFGAGLEGLAEEFGDVREDCFLEDAVDRLGFDFVARVGEKFQVEAEVGFADEVVGNDDGKAVFRARGLHGGTKIGLGERAFGGVAGGGDDAEAFFGAQGVDEFGGGGVRTGVDDGEGNAGRAGVLAVDAEDETEEPDHHEGNDERQRDGGLVAQEVGEVLTDEHEDGMHGKRGILKTENREPVIWDFGN